MGVSTPEEVCNLALLKCGERQLILDSLDEDSAVAQACKALYSHNRDFVLSAAEWSFATRRTVLALTTETRTGWEYAYGMPTRVLRPMAIWAGQRMVPSESRIPFKVELNDAADGLLVLTDQAEAELFHLVQVTSEAMYSAAFIEALACKLAMELMRALPIKPHLTQLLAQEYSVALSRAVADDRAGAVPDVEPEGGAIRARQ